MQGQHHLRGTMRPQLPRRIGILLLVLLLPMLVASSSQSAFATDRTLPSSLRSPISGDQSSVVPSTHDTSQALSLLDNPIYQDALLRLHGADLSGKDGPLQKLSFDLIYLATEFQTYRTQARTQSSVAAFQSRLPLLPIYNTAAGPMITIDAIATTDAATLLAELQTLGLHNGEMFGVMVSGQLPLALLDQLAGLVSLRFAEPALATTHVGRVTSQADRAMAADQARAAYAVSGQGVTIGVLSDSYDCLQGASADVTAGDLPPGIVVLAEEANCTTGRDEGRAMMQLMADVAPGANFAFHTAFGGRATFANGILDLAHVAGANVIVDDILYYNESMFQDGIVAQAVDQVAAAGVAYFSSAGNTGRQSYEGPYVKGLNLPLLSLGLLHDFDPGPGMDLLQSVTIPVGATAIFSLQWDQPYASTAGGVGAANDLDIMLVGLAAAPIAVSMTNNVGRDPIEVLRYTNPGPGTQFNLAIAHLRGPAPQLIKYIYFGNDVTVNEYLTASSTVFGHASAQGAIAVGAAFYGDTPAYGTTPPKVERFSSTGPTQILFDRADQPIHVIRAKPELVAPDGVNTSFFGRDINDPGDGSDRDSFPNFFGTSAAAPQVAAVAALALEAQPLLSPAELYALLQRTALRMEPIGLDEQTGFGLLQADQVVTELFQHDLRSQSISEPATALPGQPVTYTLTFIHSGPNPARSLVITNTLPTNLQNVTIGKAAFGANAVFSTITKPLEYIWKIENFALDTAGGVLTLGGIVNPHLNMDSSLTNRVRVGSVGDTTPLNNGSEATIAVVVPRVQFGDPAYVIAEDGSYSFSVTLDRINPYAATVVNYELISQPSPAVQTPLLSGSIMFEPGQTTTTLSMPAQADAQMSGLQLSLNQPSGAQLGSSTVITLTQHSDEEPLPAPNDSDGDGITDALDPDFIGVNRLYLPLIQAPQPPADKTPSGFVP